MAGLCSPQSGPEPVFHMQYLDWASSIKCQQYMMHLQHIQNSLMLLWATTTWAIQSCPKYVVDLLEVCHLHPALVKCTVGVGLGVSNSSCSGMSWLAAGGHAGTWKQGAYTRVP